MKKRMKKTRKYPKLRGKTRERAGKYIAQEVEAGRPRRQAIAIGISRARAAAKKERVMEIARKYL